MPRFEEVSYGGWARCYRLANDTLELILTGEVGPRIIRLGVPDGPNLFYEAAEHLGKSGGDQWRLYGGHRFWHAPEARPRTYVPDNHPPEVHQEGEVVHVRQATEAGTQLQKTLELQLDASAPRVKVTHRLTNHGLWPIRLAPWALSVMRAGGTALAPLPPRGEHPRDLLPSSTLTLWPYTDLSDPRFGWGERYVRLRQDASSDTPQKLGLDVPSGWCAYLWERSAFVKLFDRLPDAEYPDLGSVVEVFTNRSMLELETLGPLQTLGPEETLEHVEHWLLLQDLPPLDSEDAIDAELLPRVREAQAAVRPLPTATVKS